MRRIPRRPSGSGECLGHPLVLPWAYCALLNSSVYESNKISKMTIVPVTEKIGLRTAVKKQTQQNCPKVDSASTVQHLVFRCCTARKPDIVQKSGRDRWTVPAFSPFSYRILARYAALGYGPCSPRGILKRYFSYFADPPTLIPSPHSCLSASIGSTRDALRAGT